MSGGDGQKLKNKRLWMLAKTLLLESKILLPYNDGLPLFLCCDA